MYVSGNFLKLECILECTWAPWQIFTNPVLGLGRVHVSYFLRSGVSGRYVRMQLGLTIMPICLHHRVRNFKTKRSRTQEFLLFVQYYECNLSGMRFRSRRLGLETVSRHNFKRLMEILKVSVSSRTCNQMSRSRTSVSHLLIFYPYCFIQFNKRFPYGRIERYLTFYLIIIIEVCFTSIRIINYS